MNWENPDPTTEPSPSLDVLAKLDELAGIAPKKAEDTGEAPPEGENEGKAEGENEAKAEGGEKPAEAAAETKEATDKQPSAEEKKEAKKEEPKEEPPKADLEPFKELFPDAATIDDVKAEVKQIREDLAASEAANNELVELFDKHPEVVKILKDVRAGIPTVEAVMKHLELSAPPPDPKEDPEGYKAFVKSQVERENRERQEREAAKKAREDEERVRKWGMQKADEFRKARGISDAEMKGFGQFMNRLMNGGEDGYPPTDYFDRLWAAYKYEADVQQAKEEGRKEGRNEIAEKVIKGRQTKVGDRLPTILPGGQQPKPNDSLVELEHSIKSQRRIFS